MPIFSLRFSVMVIAAALVSACTFTPHEVQMPSFQAPTGSEVGKGTRVFYRFLDDREDPSVGRRGGAALGAAISASDLPTFVDNQLRDTLAKKGYQLVASEAQSDASVAYRLRSFRFGISRGFFVGDQDANVALAVDAHRRDQVYSTVYRSSSTQGVVVVPTGDQIDSQLNAALSEVLTKAATDSALDRTLIAR